MRITFTILCFLFSYSVCSQNSPLPKNPESGACYIRCYIDGNSESTWRKIDCDLVKKVNDLPLTNFKSDTLSPKDKKLIKKKILKFLKRGFVVEILFHYDSQASDDTNEKLSFEKGQQMSKYLESKGINPYQFIISSFGNSKPKQSCNSNNKDCNEAYAENSRFEYRVITSLPPKEGYKLIFNKETRVWCYQKIESKNKDN